jgi:peptide chain release factor 2
MSAQTGFWDNPQQAEEIMKTIRSKKAWTAHFEEVLRQLEDFETLFEFYNANEVSETEIEIEYKKTQAAIEALELKKMLSAEEDQLNAILEINAGAGGTESCDWANMLLRMYLMWAEKNGYKTTEINLQAGEVAGIKSATIEISGEFAFGYLKSENGVHRLVRISPFDSNARRHTSFASVYVYPLVDDTIQVEINPADIEWDVFRASGAGGQHVNRTESAVRLRHLPSGLVVECQQERSQHQNKDRALQLLKSRLYLLEVEKRNEKRAEIEGNKKKIEWGSQIRSYVLHPYKLIKDNRTGVERTDVQNVLDGDLNEYIKAFLMEQQEN